MMLMNSFSRGPPGCSDPEIRGRRLWLIAAGAPLAAENRGIRELWMRAANSSRGPRRRSPTALVLALARALARAL
eukprot:11227045-Lingulodinium_polyedra.AAC.1